jgi:hypothetical protein
VKKKRVSKKGDVVGALGHTGTFQALSVDLRNRSVDLRSLEKRNEPAEVLEGVPLEHTCVLAPKIEHMFAQACLAAHVR